MVGRQLATAAPVVFDNDGRLTVGKLASIPDSDGNAEATINLLLRELRRQGYMV